MLNPIRCAAGALAAVLSIAGCAQVIPAGPSAGPSTGAAQTAVGGEPAGSSLSVSRDPVYLVDRFGDRFDITHAVAHYGMRKEWFNFGIGKNTIRPINRPSMLKPGDSGYPSTSRWGSGPRVIGASFNGDTRSYPVEVLTAHEIANETIGNTQAAVAY